MNKLIDSFFHIIDSYAVLQDRVNPKITELKIRVVFTDQSILEYTEINVIQLSKRKYSFQWMKSDYQLLIRWDNALHHPHIATYPHHKHVNEEKNILESAEMTLALGQTHERLKLCSKVYLCCHDRDDEIFFRNTRRQGSAQV